MKLKFLFPLTGLVLGIVIASESHSGLYAGIIFIGVTLFIWLLIFILSKDPIKNLKFSRFHLLWIISLFAGIGCLDFEFRSKPYIDKDIEGYKVHIKGTIEDLTYSTAGDKFKIKVESVVDSGEKIFCSNLHFLVNTNGFVGSKGDIIEFNTNPISIFSSKYKPEYSDHLRHKGILYTSNIGFEDINKTGEKNSILLYLSKLRNKLIEKIENSSLKRSTSEFIISVILGDKTLLSSSVKQTLNAAGMSHILALSGMHVAIILSIILLLLFPLNFFGYRKLRLIIALIIIWIYVLFSGSAPSTIRAAIMASFITGAFLLERKNVSLNALLAAVFFILLFNPLLIWDVGLQFSFVCVAGIILFIDQLNPIEQHKHPKLYRAIEVVLITLITTLCSLPLTAYYFKTIPLLFLPSNLLLLPLLPLFVGLGIFYILFLSIGIDLVLCGKILDLFLDNLIYLIDKFSMSGNTMISINYSPLSIFLWLTGFIGLAIMIRMNPTKYRYTFGIISTILLFSSIAFIYITPKPSSEFIKFKHSFTKMELEFHENQNITNLNFERNSISSASIKNTVIVAIDQKIHPDSLSLLSSESKVNKKFLFLASGIDNEQMAQLINKSKPNGVILHAGIGKNKKEELLRLVDPSLWEQIYALGENGSLEVEL